MHAHSKFTRDIFVFVLLFIVWFCLFRFTGSINKGYNIYEDNVYVTTHSLLDSGSVLKVSSDFIKIDAAVKYRFRPFWAFHLILATYFTGANLTYYTFYIICLGIFSSFFLYKFITIAGYSTIEGIISGLLIVAGPAAIIWSDITDSENIGMFMMSLTLYFLSKSIYPDKSKNVFRIFFMISLLLTSLCKESFILMIPAVIILYLILYAKKENISFVRSLKQNQYMVAFSALMFLILILSIVFTVGINNQTYAGIDPEFFSLKAIFDYLKIIFSFPVTYLILAGMLILLISDTTKDNIIRKIRTRIKNHSAIIILFFLITLPQFILYYKTGLDNRYLLPFMMGFYFLLIYIIKKVFENKNILVSFRIIYISLVFYLIIYEIVFKSVPLLNNFAKSCKETTKLTQAIIDNSTEGSDLLFVMDPVQNYHEVYSMKIFLDSYDLKEKYYYDFVKSEYVNPVFADTAFYNRCESDAYTDLGNGLINLNNNRDQIENIMIFRSLESKFLEKNKDWLKEENYKKEKFGGNVLYRKK